MIKMYSNTPKSRSRVNIKLRKINSNLYNILFLKCIWIFNHTCGYSLGIGASTKRLFGLKKTVEHLSNYLIK